MKNARVRGHAECPDPVAITGHRVVDYSAGFPVAISA
jgi:hypothetical protein